MCSISRDVRFRPQSSSDLPLLVTVRDLGRRLLASLIAPPETQSDYPPPSPSTSTTPSRLLPRAELSDSSVDYDSFRIGFITPPFRDSKIPVTDHLHAHAYIMPADLMGWWRGVGFSPLAWYSVEDLIAEIRYVSRYGIVPCFLVADSPPLNCLRPSTFAARTSHMLTTENAHVVRMMCFARPGRRLPTTAFAPVRIVVVAHAPLTSYPQLVLARAQRTV